MDKYKLQQAIDKEVKETDAKVSLLVENLDTNEVLLSYETEKVVVSASVIKVPIMLTALELVQDGKLKINTMIEMPEATIHGDSEVFEYGSDKYTLEELLVWMIINSDNSSNDYAMRLIGRISKLVYEYYKESNN